VFTTESLAAARTGYAKARQAALGERRPAVLVVRVRQRSWTEAGAWWEVGVPEDISGHADLFRHKPGQVRYLGG
jgi:3D-(3,5/4)-trihydroxycyclohexane-1,2-dione acylhydrolase (decyclizing)